jgi:hypothetical protein
MFLSIFVIIFKKIRAAASNSLTSEGSGSGLTMLDSAELPDPIGSESATWIKAYTFVFCNKFRPVPKYVLVIFVFFVNFYFNLYPEVFLPRSGLVRTLGTVLSVL